MSKTVLIVGLVLGCAAVLVAQQAANKGVTSKNNARLRQALKQYPEADANSDGVLTWAEGRAFQRKRAGKRGGKKEVTAAKAPAGGERMVYKQVGAVELPLYVYQPQEQSSDAQRPAIVFFFGGGWNAGSPTQFEHQCKHLAKRGMVAITVEYRVKSRHGVKVEDCVEDAKSAMRWVRANARKLGIDPGRIASGGGSAGGHLAACTALVEDFDAATDNVGVSAKPDAMVLFNPAMGQSERQANTSQGMKDRTHGDPAKVTPLTFASTKQPPCIMFFGTDDGLLEGAELFREKSVEAGNRCEIVTYDGQGHGFFNYRENGNQHFDLTLAAADRFLVKLGWLAAK